MSTTSSARQTDRSATNRRLEDLKSELQQRDQAKDEQIRLLHEKLNQVLESKQATERSKRSEAAKTNSFRSMPSDIESRAADISVRGEKPAKVEQPQDSIASVRSRTDALLAEVSARLRSHGHEPPLFASRFPIVPCLDFSKVKRLTGLTPPRPRPLDSTKVLAHANIKLGTKPQSISTSPSSTSSSSSSDDKHALIAAPRAKPTVAAAAALSLVTESPTR